VPAPFGSFYLGSSWQKAREWAEMRARESGADPAVVVFATAPIQYLINREDNFSLDGPDAEEDWDWLVNSCRNFTYDILGDWARYTQEYTSITGPMGKKSGDHRIQDPNTWQLAVLSPIRVYEEFIPAISRIIVWGVEPKIDQEVIALPKTRCNC
jgi:hypothetical protein